VVKFGFNATPADVGRSSTYPFVVWNWDIDRECWTGDDKFSADLHFAQAIPSLTVTGATTPPGPSGTPSALASTIVSSTTSSAVVTWTNGDAGAQTEVWLRTETGASMLSSIESAGVVTKTITSLDPGRIYYAKVRHKKDGLYSDFTSEATVYTRLATPVVTVPSEFDEGGGFWFVYINTAGLSYVHPSTNIRGVASWGHDDQVPMQVGGITFGYNDVPVSQTYSVTFINTTWPVGYTVGPATVINVP
jgi:hypothetical protein